MDILVRVHAEYDLLALVGHVVTRSAAVALVDEAELPRFVQRRFTIGY